MSDNKKIIWIEDENGKGHQVRRYVKKLEVEDYETEECVGYMTVIEYIDINTGKIVDIDKLKFTNWEED